MPVKPVPARKPLTNRDLVAMARFALEDDRGWSPTTRERGRRAFEILALNIDDSDSVPEASLHRLAYQGRRGVKTTHGRHCHCTACKREDWTQPHLQHCGMHGDTCPALAARSPSRTEREQ